MGAVVIQRLSLVNNVILVINHEWRGKAYDFADRDTWPVSDQELKRMLGRFGRIKTVWKE